MLKIENTFCMISECNVVEQLLDSRNSKFWDDISVNLHPSIILYNGKCCNHHYFQKTVQLYVPAHHCSIEAFTHELLHVWLRSKHMFITEFLLRQLKEEPLLYWSFTDHLFQQIGSCLEHVKMLPYFLEAGFKRELFSEEDETFRFTPMQMQIIRSGMKENSKKISIPCLDLYINRFFMIKSSANDRFDYSDYLSFLNDVRPELFLLLNDFWNSWNKFNIEHYDAVNYSYKPFTSHFIHELGKWAVNAIHAKQVMLDIR